MSDGDGAQHPARSLDTIDDAVAAYPKLQAPFQLTVQRFASRGIGGESANRRFNGAFDLWGQLTDGFGSLRANVDAIAGHYRRFLRLRGTSGSPNTSSKESPF